MNCLPIQPIGWLRCRVKHCHMPAYPLSIFRLLLRFSLPVPIHDCRPSFGKRLECLKKCNNLQIKHLSIPTSQFFSNDLVPQPPLTLKEKRGTLVRLNQVIQHRLVNLALPNHMRKFKIEHGRVTFCVEREFEVTMTLMGDTARSKWRVLDIKILVADKEASDGKDLVSTNHLNWLKQFTEAYLERSSRVLLDLFDILHGFCQMVQMEVLLSQANRLKADRWGENIHVEDYKKGERLVVSYWRVMCYEAKDLCYKLTIKFDASDDRRPLTVFHSPAIGDRESVEVADRSVRSDTLSLERLLVHTIYIRSLVRLNDLKAEFETFLKDVDCKL